MRRRCIPLLAVSALLLGSAACGGAATTAGREVIAPRAPTQAPYSAAIRSGDYIFLSGVIGTRPGAGLVEGGIQAETRQALANMRDVLRAAGADLQDVLKCTVFLADIRDYDAMNEAYRQVFSREPPARSTIGVSGLPAGARVEIECIAAARG